MTFISRSNLLFRRAVAPLSFVLALTKSNALDVIKKTLNQRLRDENIIIMNESFHIYNDFIKAYKIKGFTPNIKAKTMDGGTLMHLCRQKIGIAISPKFEDEAPAGLKAIAFEEPYHWDIYGTFRKNSKDDSIKKLQVALLPQI